MYYCSYIDIFSSCLLYSWQFTTKPIIRSISSLVVLSRRRCNVFALVGTHMAKAFPQCHLGFYCWYQCLPYTVFVVVSKRGQKGPRSSCVEKARTLVDRNHPMLMFLRSFKQTLVFLAKTGSITALLSLCALAIYCIWPRSRGTPIKLLCDRNLDPFQAAPSF